MNYKKILFFIIMICIFAIGCGKKEESFTLMIWGTPEEVKTVKNLVEKYRIQYKKINKKNLEIKVINLNWAEYFQKLQMMLNSKNDPDLFYMNADSFGFYMKQNFLEDLTPYIEKSMKIDKNNFFKKPFEYFKVDGKYYAMCKGFTPIVLYYNKSLFDKYKVEEPNKNWDTEKLKEISNQITVALKKERQKFYGFYVDGYFGWMWNWFWMFGGEFFDEKGNWVFGSPKYKENNAKALDYLISMILNNSAPVRGEQTQLMHQEALINGTVAMCTYGRWATQTLAQKASSSELDWRCTVMPKGPDKRVTTMAPGAYVISRRSKKKKEAWKMIEFLLSNDAQKEIAKSGLELPILKDVAKSKAFLEASDIKSANPNFDSQPFIDSTDEKFMELRCIYPHPKLSEITSVFDVYISKAFTKEGDSTKLDGLQTVENIDKRVKKILANK